MAVRHAAQIFCTDTQKIMVFTDSQAALRYIKNDKEDQEKPLRSIGGWDLLKKNPTIKIIYRWVPGHRVGGDGLVVPS
jgi:ribonuclease HI